ncbi:hypothetical protein FW778_13400 [Ginsengibacter hankyongi]|uniref:Uncharacterized protein n=1 Tax=Ginsengibacter hankyongi TaxID=2607284 RepID=A0A5J5IFK9_9BACT|nr:hypothetical protein [Ginsengibacter hankyongi]KAA9038549.1 hypothetical protein FW778_13400 [Ginsengibacter hankyongi]
MTVLDTDVKHSPDYIREFVKEPDKNGVAELLIDGNWCGHGEETCRVYDVADKDNYTFEVQLPETEAEELFPKAIKLTSTISGTSFLAYDTRKHPASFYSTSEFAGIKSEFSDKISCRKCGKGNFKVAVGFEVPEDSDSPNDITWFALATECIQCGDKTISFEDETA